MALVKWQPHRELQPFGGLKNEMDRLFDDFFNNWPSVAPLRHMKEADVAYMPSVNIREEKNEYIMEADLPGMTKDDLKLKISETSITLEGERKHKFEKTEESEGYYVMESSFGAFRRVIPLPEAIDTEKVEAKLKDGLLGLKLPKLKSSKEKQIKITEE